MLFNNLFPNWPVRINSHILQGLCTVDTTTDLPVCHNITPRMSLILFVTLSIYLNAFQTYRRGPLPKPTHISKPSAPPTHKIPHTHAPAKPRPCPCLLAAVLYTGSILLGHWLRGAGVSGCAAVCVFTRECFLCVDALKKRTIN